MTSEYKWKQKNVKNFIVYMSYKELEQKQNQHGHLRYLYLAHRIWTNYMQITHYKLYHDK